MSTSPLPGTVLHVVSATRGSYSDRRTWTVAAYLDHALAEKHRELAQAEGERRSKAYDEDFSFPVDETPNPYDTNLTDVWIEAPRYYVEVLFVHLSVEAYATTEQVLLDHAREQGWVP